MPFDTTFDTTQSATCRNGRQPPARKSAYLSLFCNIWQRPETGVRGLSLPRSRVRVPSVTPISPTATKLRGCLGDILDSVRTRRIETRVNPDAPPVPDECFEKLASQRGARVGRARYPGSVDIAIIAP